MKKSAIAILTAALVACMIPVAAFAQTDYIQDFESLAMVDGSLAADGWLVYGNIFDSAGNHIWGHGPWPAPNNQDPGNWCDIVAGEGGAPQGAQQLVFYSDYANADHQTDNLIESNLFQEQVLPVGASGTWYFAFDAKMGTLAGASTAAAFIKILNPADWSTTLYSVDMTNTPETWTNYSLSVDVTGLDGMYLQFGFMSTCSHYEPSGVYYDNVIFTDDGTVPTEGASWGDVKSLYR